MTQQEFIAWELASRDTIDVKRCYVDMAEEDLVAGILLSQILYWHLPDKYGQTKLSVDRDGEKWLAKSREDWWEECRIRPKQFDRAIEILERLGIVATKVYKFGGNPTKHIRICWDVFLRELALIGQTIRGGNNDIARTGITKSTNRQKRSPRLRNKEVPESAKSSTETPSETPQRIQTKNQTVLPSASQETGFQAFKRKQAALREQTRRKIGGTP